MKCCSKIQMLQKWYLRLSSATSRSMTVMKIDVLNSPQCFAAEDSKALKYPLQFILTLNWSWSYLPGGNECKCGSSWPRLRPAIFLLQSHYNICQSPCVNRAGNSLENSLWARGRADVFFFFFCQAQPSSSSEDYGDYFVFHTLYPGTTPFLKSGYFQ